MNKAALACDGLNQLASASTTSDEEASEQLMHALSSTDPFPINLAWIVPLLNYKHISSLTTHLKRHFAKDEHFQKFSSGGARTHIYRISIYCFREICQFARHSERRTLAQHWIKVIDDVVGDSLPPPPPSHTPTHSKKKPRKSKVAKSRHTTTTTPTTLHPKEVEEEEDEFEEDYDDDDDDYPEVPLVEGDHRHPPSFQQQQHSASDDDDEEADIEENKSTSLLKELSATASYHHQHPTAASPPPPAPDEAASPSSPPPMTAMYTYNIASTHPKFRIKKDFASVSILNRKRKPDDALPSPTKTEPTSDDTARNRDTLSTARPNLRILSELALGLR